MSIDRFPICIPFTLRQECNVYTGKAADWSNPRNFDNDPHDRGGRTQCGIIQKEYDLWRKGHGLPTQDVRKLTMDEGLAIYRIGYWEPHCAMLAPGLDLQFFDEAVNAGTHEATLILQHTFGVHVDGDWGPETAAAAVLSWQNTRAKIEAFAVRREAVYRSFSSFRYFGTDWIRRATEIDKEGLAMVGASDGSTAV